MKSPTKIVKDILSNNREEEWNEFSVRPSSQPFVCKKCGAQFGSTGELFEHKGLAHGRYD